MSQQFKTSRGSGCACLLKLNNLTGLIPTHQSPISDMRRSFLARIFTKGSGIRVKSTKLAHLIADCRCLTLNGTQRLAQGSFGGGRYVNTSKYLKMSSTTRRVVGVAWTADHTTQVSTHFGV